MGTNFPAWLAGVTASEVVVLVAAAAWFVRRVIRAQDETRAVLARLITYVEIDKVVGPRVQTQLDDLGDTANEVVRRQDVFDDWRRGHEAWHERHDYART